MSARLAEVHLEDKYTLEAGRVFMTGVQALVRLPMAQRRRDLDAGRNTAGYISGYRGSPLGALDQQLKAARAHLDAHHVRFQPGVNEDLAATALWGTQQAQLDGEGAYAGVFGMWYGKGPGVDRSGDALRHANLAGTAPLGGVLALLGDDHICESSTTAHQSEFAMVDAMIPVLNPAGVQDILDFGLYGFAMSRYSGCWVALKCVHDTVESGASVVVDPQRIAIVQPADYAVPEGGLSIRWPDSPLAQEARLHEHKLDAARAFCRANALDRLVFPGRGARMGIVTTGKSYLEVRQALTDLGIDAAAAERLGLRLYKVAMPWPLEPDGLRRFCDGLEQVLVVEEKRALMETQVKELMYGRADAPRVLGKRDASGRLRLPSSGRLDSNGIALFIGEMLLGLRRDEALARRVESLAAIANQAERPLVNPVQRMPYFCPGCPHNSSTKVPAGSKALAGIGCHYMAQWMDRDTARYTQMGAEGASWIGQAPFSTRRHMFQNIGDGTYYHSGLLAVRAAVAAETNITFKILYNDAVAMTGGQPMDGPLSVAMITRQVHAEGVKRVVVVTDDPDKYPSAAGFAPGVTVHHRERLDTVQRELREIEGTTVLVYDQTCAAENRRRRKRGTYPDPARRVFINDAVCEGCGDCGLKSNCVAIVPRETSLGRKRAIDQSACNKDYSCVEGFCPSFVSVLGGRPRRGVGAGNAAAGEDFPPLPEPALPALGDPYAIIVTGVGGTGVITIGALLGMAAHLEGKGCTVLDMTGLAQKGGAVMTHLRIGARPEDVSAARISAGGADLLLGCDILVTGGHEVLAGAARGRTHAVVNTHEAMPGEFTRDPDLAFPAGALTRAIESAVGRESFLVLDASRLARTLMGDSIGGNILLLGHAYQRGLVPVSAAAILRAVELNGVAVEMNRRAFEWGRRAAEWPERVQRAAAPAAEVPMPGPRASLDTLVAERAALLREYQNDAYAIRYTDMVQRVRAVEAERARGRRGLAEAVARSYHKLLAYKDEYEVARLYSDPRFREGLEREFEGDFRIEFHLAPPLLAWRRTPDGEPRKLRFGQWMMPVFKLLAALRGLRGTPFDPFGRTADRRLERRLVADYEARVAELLDRLDADNHALALEIASLPEQVRGFGHVKRRHLQQAREREEALLAAFRAGQISPEAA